MKKVIQIILLVLGSIGLLIGVIWTSMWGFSKLPKKVDVPCTKTSHYYIDVSWGADNPAGYDYEKAKDMAAGRPIYSYDYCI